MIGAVILLFICSKTKLGSLDLGRSWYDLGIKGQVNRNDSREAHQISKGENKAALFFVERP